MRSIGPKNDNAPQEDVPIPAVDPNANYPLAPRTFESTGLSLKMVTGLLLKSMYTRNFETLQDVADFVKLPPLVLAKAMGFAEELDYVERLGKEGTQRLGSMRYRLSEQGRRVAIDELEQSRYVGPAPVGLTDYRNQMGRQRILREKVDSDQIRDGLSEMVVTERLIDAIGPAVVDGHSLLMFGPPGNGKSLISHAIASIYREAVYVPYALTVDEEIIRVFDPTIHHPIEATDAPATRPGEVMDERWVACHRPTVVTGGELTLDPLELSYNAIGKVYNGSLQLKANCGVLVIDDFGRQTVRPEDILNRWIVPLEMRHDYLRLTSGSTFQVPFDVFLIFSTNLDVNELFDQATRRRVQYKVEMNPPEREEYTEIMAGVLPDASTEQIETVVGYLYERYYDPLRIEPSRYHPKWVITQADALCRFRGNEFKLNDELVDFAMANL